ncbi:MgtC/SapB family protein [Hwanghaeella grinnelliae]|uniref:Protein MgtC n=1 Tax=Hwanghaeella grinnelliae TaxID=2500179 RepID=A0A437QWN7_9PROT|nr:MgtC/SapB family protein [Hwanghaeella grinnelliae]RVU38942.1 MgtC/SapB family protein [Hwanghaeella grinnelliae]
MTFETEIPIADMAIRLACACGFAFFLGLDREVRGKAAGLRTHMLVSLGSAAFIIMGMSLLFATAEGDPSASIDPTRIIDGVIGGIGFLGAGAIIQSGGDIKGLTTGASVWAAGAIGLACGLGYLPLAALFSGFAVTIVLVLGHFEHKVIEEKD